jgi:hypothetical protein
LRRWSPDGDGGVNTGNTAQLWVNAALSEFLTGFKSLTNPNPTGNNLDVQILLEQTSAPPLVAGPQITLQASGSLTSVGTTCTWTNSPVLHGLSPGPLISGDAPPLNQFVVISGATPVAYNGVFTVITVPDRFTFTYTALAGPGAPAAGSPTMVGLPRGSQIPGQYNAVTEQTPSVPSWDQFITLRFVSDALATREEFLPPVGLSQIGARRILFDLEVLSDTHLDDRNYLQFQNPGQYRWAELVSDAELRRVDIRAVWVDKTGNEHRIPIPDGDAMTIKMILKRVH